MVGFVAFEVGKQPKGLREKRKKNQSKVEENTQELNLSLTSDSFLACFGVF